MDATGIATTIVAVATALGIPSVVGGLVWFGKRLWIRFFDERTGYVSRLVDSQIATQASLANDLRLLREATETLQDKSVQTLSHQHDIAVAIEQVKTVMATLTETLEDCEILRDRLEARAQALPPDEVEK